LDKIGQFFPKKVRVKGR